jgi:hypothetical protein
LTVFLFPHFSRQRAQQRLAERVATFHLNLWLFGADEAFTEVGAMNFFVAPRDAIAHGKKELVTAVLSGDP